MNEKDIDLRLEKMEDKLLRLQKLEKEIKEKEKAIKEKDGAKKQVPLRLAPGLWEEISRWADEDYRSINGQIEFLLAKAVSERKRK